jgi:hypothetical protein
MRYLGTVRRLRCTPDATRTGTYVAHNANIPHRHRSAKLYIYKKRKVEEGTHVRATSSANASVLCTDAKSSTCIAMTRFARNVATRFAPSAVVLNCATSCSCSNNSNSCERAASARCRLRHAMMRVTPAQGHSSSKLGSCLAVDDGGKRGRASSGLFCARP